MKIVLLKFGYKPGTTYPTMSSVVGYIGITFIMVAIILTKVGDKLC